MDAINFSLSADTEDFDSQLKKADVLLGMLWWNRLTKSQRASWLKLANSAVPADAWRKFKICEYEEMDKL